MHRPPSTWHTLHAKCQSLWRRQLDGSSGRQRAAAMFSASPEASNETIDKPNFEFKIMPRVLPAAGFVGRPAASSAASSLSDLIGDRRRPAGPTGPFEFALPFQFGAFPDRDKQFFFNWFMIGPLDEFSGTSAGFVSGAEIHSRRSPVNCHVPASSAASCFLRRATLGVLEYVPCFREYACACAFLSFQAY